MIYQCIEARTGFHITYTCGHLKVGGESTVFFLYFLYSCIYFQVALSFLAGNSMMGLGRLLFLSFNVFSHLMFDFSNLE
jgi:hypothetical protein